MKRNQFGINMDEGLALTSEQEFEQLYVNVDSEDKQKLEEWIKNGSGPILFGGQIGTGKSTLIEYTFRETRFRPHITIHFDRGSLNISSIDIWSNVFCEIFRFIAENHWMDRIKMIPEFYEFLGKNADEWKISTAKIRLESFSTDAIKKNSAFNDMLNSLLLHLPEIFHSFIRDLQSFLKKEKDETLFIFASGVDKFEPGTAAYFGLSEIIPELLPYKTLIEVNAVHMFSGDAWTRSIEKLFLSSSSTEWISEMLQKRLGKYSPTYEAEIKLLSGYSGGIPRQALRLMDSFLAEIKYQKESMEAVSRVIANVNRDYFAFAPKPSDELMSTVKKDEELQTTLISLPGDKDTAKRAVYGNWIILQGQKHENAWSAKLNPIIEKSVDLTHHEPERILLQEYALQRGISGNGLEVNVVEIQDHLHKLLREIESSLNLGIEEVLHIIGAALLSKDRTDRIIIVYDNARIAEVVRSYLQAKSNTYEYQTWKHATIHPDIARTPLVQMLDLFSDKTIDIYSMEFEGDFSEEQLSELNLRRDFFIDKQILWWIPKNKLSKYLTHWTQLRQLFQIMILDEDLSRSITPEEIEFDIKFMQDLVEEEESAPAEYVKHLQEVLKYLQEIKHG